MSAHTIAEKPTARSREVKIPHSEYKTTEELLSKKVKTAPRYQKYWCTDCQKYVKDLIWHIRNDYRHVQDIL